MKFNVGDRVVAKCGVYDEYPGVVTKIECCTDGVWYSVLHTNGGVDNYPSVDLRAYDPDTDGDFDISEVLNVILSNSCVRQAEPIKQLKICAEFNGICMHDHEAKEKRITINIAEVVAVSESVIEELGKTCIDVGNGTRFYVKETYDEVRNALGWEV
jgi:hypothetical protein